MKPHPHSQACIQGECEECHKNVQARTVEGDFQAYFKGNIDEDSVLHVNTKYVKTFIDSLLSTIETEIEGKRQPIGYCSALGCKNCRRNQDLNDGLSVAQEVIRSYRV